MPSRGRPRCSDRPLVEDLACVDASQLRSQLGPGNWIDVTTTIPDVKKTTTLIRLTSTKPNYGGLRYWLLCPECGKRMRKLYLAEDDDGRWSCRLCLKAAYRSQYRKSSQSVAVRSMKQWQEGSRAYKRRWAEGIEERLAEGQLTWEQAWEVIQSL